MTISSYEENYEAAVRFAMRALRTASDWQEAQHALADSDYFRPWIDSVCADDAAGITLCQVIISEAEDRLGNQCGY